MRKFYLFLFAIIPLLGLSAQDEKLLVNENFQSWTKKGSSTTESTVIKTTDFSNETLTYKLKEIAVEPTGTQTKFNYEVVTEGYLMCAKTATPYIELSPLASITKVEFIHAATGGNRGYKLWKKVGSGDWEVISDAVANPAGGDVVSIDINEENVALKFTNLDAGNNAYLTDLKIWGNYSSSAPQVELNASMNIEGAGTITRSIISDTYDQGTEITLTATANFGYKFVKWTDASNTELSTSTSYTFTLDSDKSVIAVFEAIQTYNFTLNIEGSQWGEVKLSPEPTEGKYEAGTVVTASVISNPVTTFNYWEDTSNSSTRVIQVNSDVIITATFDEIPFIVGWDFKAQEPRTGRAGDFYSETTNTGTISLYQPNGSPVNWLANTGSFNPSYPCARIWTTGANFDTERRYFETSFSTIGYKNIEVKSMVSGNYQVYSKQKMQYSVNGTDFVDLNNVDITSVYNSGWADCNATLPSDAERQSKIYIRWIADTSSPLLGNSGDNDGMALTNIFVYADEDRAEDTTPPTLISTIPAEGSNTASVNGVITLTFDERVQAGTGDITLDGESLASEFGSKTATFKYSKLSYNTLYTLTVPAGAITDMAGNPFAGTTLTFTTMNRQQPIATLYNYVVAKDGSGDGTTVQEAINAAPSDGSRFLVFIKNGKYEERPSISSSKSNISFIGQSIDDVVISAAVYSGLDGATTSTCQTFEVLGDNMYFENLTIENTAGVDAGQAVALKDYGKYNTYKNVRLLGHQDTHLTGNSSLQYYKDCDIRGTVDFIFGGGDIFFDNCLLYLIGRSNGDCIVAPSTLSSSQYGYVFRDCIIDGDVSTQNNKYSLGRPWQNAPRTVYINTTMKILPTAAGWSNMGVIPALFAEYNSMDSNGNQIDLSNRKSEFTTSGGQTTSGLQTILADTEAAQYTVENVLSNSDNWDPAAIIENTEAPVISQTSSSISWSKVDYAIGYIVIKDGNVIANITENSYQPTEDGNYSVFAVSEFGALSTASNSIAYSTTGIENKETQLSIAQEKGYVNVSNIPNGTNIKIYSFNGIMIQNISNISEYISIPVNQNVILQVVMPNETKVYKFLKK